MSELTLRQKVGFMGVGLLARAFGARASIDKDPTGLFTNTSSDLGYGMLAGIAPGGRGDPPPRGTRDLLRAYTTMPWLRAVNNKVSHAVASTPWVLYARERNRRPLRDITLQSCGDRLTRDLLLDRAKAVDELRPILDHPFLDAMNGGNSYLTGLALRKLLQTHLDLVGEAFWIKERNAMGAPIAYWPVPPSWVTATPTPQAPWYVVSFRAWQGMIPDSEMLWIVDPDPEQPYGRGSGIARSLGDELETDEYAAKHTKAWFYNRARPDLIITAEGLRQADTQRLEQDWLNKTQGFWRAFKPYFMNKKVDVTQISQTFENMQLVPLRQFERDTIIQVYGVPPETMGILNASNRSTIEAADAIFSRYVLLPRLEFLRAVFQQRLAPEYDDRLIVDYIAPVIEDKEFKLAAAKTAPWTLTADEWREFQGRPPLANGAGVIHHVPLYMAPTDDLRKMPTPPAHNTPGSSGTQNAPRGLDPTTEVNESACWSIARALGGRLVHAEANGDMLAVRQILAAAYIAAARVAGDDSGAVNPRALLFAPDAMTVDSAEDAVYEAARLAFIDASA